MTTLRLQTGNFACPERACAVPRECTLRNNYYNAVDRDCAEEPVCPVIVRALMAPVYRARYFIMEACDTLAVWPVKSFSHVDIYCCSAKYKE